MGKAINRNASCLWASAKQGHLIDWSKDPKLLRSRVLRKGIWLVPRECFPSATIRGVR
jgi:hypothetical protein